MPKKSIEIGAIYGDMQCIEKVASRRNHARFKVKCTICGKEKEVYGTNLKSGEGTSHATSCKPALATIGEKYGDLEVIAREANRGYTQAYRVRCTVCGRERVVLYDQLRRGNGIYHKWCIYQVGFNDVPFRERWQNMRNRTNPDLNIPANITYREKGIKSDAFKNFIDFYDAMYESYLEHVKIYGVHNTTLDRIDNNKDYSPENCRWATWDVQANNKGY